MRLFAFIITLFTSVPAVYANTYIEFGHFDKVQEISLSAGALSACSKDESIDTSKRNLYQILQLQLMQVNDDYFNLIYRIVAVSDLPVSVRKGVIDEFRKVEVKRDIIRNDGSNAINKGEMNCDNVEAFATEIIEY
jgi:hypothetical protein